MPVAVVAAVALVAGVVGFVVLGGDEAGAAEVMLEPATSPGPDPFSESMAVVEVAEFPGEVEAVITDARAELPSSDGVLTPLGTEPGLYGGTDDEAACDASRLVAFLEDNPDKARAWAQVAGIDVDDIGAFVGSLTSVVLTTDTWVTNHGFADGEATPRQSVLQAGTAVMVDDRGVPRVKCGCGNPLLEPTGGGTPTSDDDAWEGYDPDQVAVVTAGHQTDSFTLVDVDTGDTFQQPAGTGGGTTVEQLLNAEVPWTVCAQGAAQLVDGEFQRGDPPAVDFARMEVIETDIADVTGDGVDEGVILVVESCGGDTFWESVFVYSGSDLLAPLDLSGELLSARILDDGTIEVQGNELRECLGCPDGAPFTLRFRWDGSEFVEVDGAGAGSGTEQAAPGQLGNEVPAEALELAEQLARAHYTHDWDGIRALDVTQEGTSDEDFASAQGFGFSYLQDETFIPVGWEQLEDGWIALRGGLIADEGASPAARTRFYCTTWDVNPGLGKVRTPPGVTTLIRDDPGSVPAESYEEEVLSTC